MKLALPLLALLLAGSAAAEEAATLRIEPCGSLDSSYGPFDYRTDRKMLDIVEKHHFTPLVENLIKPMFSQFAADFDYTLKTSPNHHRALISMARYSLRVKDPKPPGATYTVDCYFERGMRFRPDDLMVRMIYADYLVKAGRVDEAVKHLDYVTTQAGDNAFTHYNLGSIYLQAKEYDKSATQAQEALRLGLPRTELKDELVKLGKWSEPAAAAAAASAAASAPASAPATASAAAAEPAPPPAAATAAASAPDGQQPH